MFPKIKRQWLLANLRSDPKGAARAVDGENWSNFGLFLSCGRSNVAACCIFATAIADGFR
jgi:hypothetical protein